jgi:hypothetical protein
MFAGMMRWPIAIEYKKMSAPSPTSGAVTPTWGELLRTRACMETSSRAGTRSAWETFTSQQIKKVRFVMFQIRYQLGPATTDYPNIGDSLARTPIDESMRIRYLSDSSIWSIKQITNVQTRNREMWIFAEYGVTDQ